MGAAHLRTALLLGKKIRGRQLLAYLTCICLRGPDRPGLHPRPASASSPCRYVTASTCQHVILSPTAFCLYVPARYADLVRAVKTRQDSASSSHLALKISGWVRKRESQHVAVLFLALSGGKQRLRPQLGNVRLLHCNHISSSTRVLAALRLPCGISFALGTAPPRLLFGRST